MSPDLYLMALTAASIGFVHTIAGPDHYVPFIAMAKARNWSTNKTVWITALCGVGHVGSSVVLGLIGVSFGLAVSHFEKLEFIRGNIAGWALIAFGLVYAVWGFRRAARGKTHTHTHVHADGHSHLHIHDHSDDHLHVHGDAKQASLTPWVLFTIFVFGPCEPLIPLVMYPAARHSTAGMIAVTVTFAVVTIATMLSLVLLTLYGMRLVPLSRAERYSHAVAGLTILVCGITVQFLGL